MSTTSIYGNISVSLCNRLVDKVAELESVVAAVAASGMVGGWFSRRARYPRLRSWTEGGGGRGGCLSVLGSLWG